MYRKYIKRLLDFILSLCAIIVLSPIFIVVIIIILIDDYGPIFFKQKRVGKNKKIFNVIKFRTMVVNAEKYQIVGKEITGSDSRILKSGYVLRRLKIDELPQLINILKGDMSIVGPRPTLPEYLSEYEEWELKRFDVRTGLTGLAQVNGNIYLSREERSKYDIEYIDHITFFNDIKIIIKTILVIIFGEGKFKKEKIN